MCVVSDVAASRREFFLSKPRLSIWWASMEGRLEAVQAFIAAEADMNKAGNDDG